MASIPPTHADWIAKGRSWFEQQGWQPFPFQLAAWEAYLSGSQGVVNAPTGSGKTYSLVEPFLLEFLRDHPEKKQATGIQAIWVTPIRALAREIQMAAAAAIAGLGLDWKVSIRTGDTSSSERAKQLKEPPGILITTPESLHLMLASKGYPAVFKHLKAFVADEWHELMGSKRGVQVELALSRLKTLAPAMKIWGISATIGNMEEAIEVLLGNNRSEKPFQLIRSDIRKSIEVIPVLPKAIETFPWSGHLGIRMLDQVIPILHKHNSTLIFTNTRAQCEIWYQQLLDADPSLAGWIAMHHGSISRELRDWVENALHEGQLKAVVCTSSLDLGVDFRPVEAIVQIGSPKGVARFMQRAGRSGHQPGAPSIIYFVPTHTLELVESAALRAAIAQGDLEDRIPYFRSFDVLLQYLVTLAVSDGFRPADIFREIKTTFSYSSVSEPEWQWLLQFITTGGASLDAYDEFHKVIVENGVYKVTDRRIALQHRLSIGTIANDAVLQIKYIGGSYLGTVEEWFIAQLQSGDVFWFAGKSLEFVRIKDMTVQVRRSDSKTGKVPSWMGGRMPLSSRLSAYIRQKMDELAGHHFQDLELKALEPVMAVQRRRSHIPREDELLMEYFQSREGFHLLVYPYEGRFVHEGLGTLLAYRISRLKPISFTIAMNDYGFELLSDSPIPVEAALEAGLFRTANLSRDIQAGINEVEMARRRFREIAAISGLVFKGYPGRNKKEKHLQASSQLFFEVFSTYEPDHLLLEQAYEEVRTFQLEESRLRAALERINGQKICLMRPSKATPFAFPILVDRLREKLSSEKLEDRIAKMKRLLEKD